MSKHHNDVAGVSTLKVTALKNESEFDSFMEDWNKRTLNWEHKAARGETHWVCSWCCCAFDKGMPSDCPHKSADCTQLLRRDKFRAGVVPEFEA